MSRFVQPGGNTTTLTLANGDTLIVKRRLNAAESRVMKGMQALPTLAEAGVVMAYLVDWSLTADDGTRIVILDVTPKDFATVLDALDEDDFDEIYAAIEAHRVAMIAERAAQKKTKTPGADLISPSPSGVTGASTGSAN